MSENKRRLDQHLVDLGLAPSRTKAKELIETEQVEVNGPRGFQIITQASFSLKSPAPEVRLKSTDLLKYVARSGLKLEAALDHLQLNVKGLQCLDLGSSTGGFMHCLLERGAAHITGVDVGTGQLHEKLQNHPQVTNYENLNVKDLDSDQRFEGMNFDLITADLSFISVTQSLNGTKKLLRPEGDLLFLIKPQFELGKAALDKNGIVKDKSLYNELESSLTDRFVAMGFEVRQYFKSELKGRDGNEEFFIHAKL